MAACFPTLELQFILLLPTPITNNSKWRKPVGGIKARMQVTIDVSGEHLRKGGSLTDDGRIGDYSFLTQLE
jgi:hypothetical protein